MNWILRTTLVAALLVHMPSARAKEDRWVEARSPNFIVVTDASPQQARGTAIQFEQIRELFQNSLSYAKDRPTPVITILAAKDENGMRELLPEYWATKNHAHPAGIFLDSRYQFAIAVQLSGTGDNPYEPIYHEYYHSLTVPYFPKLPVWVSEGLADFYGNSKVVGKSALLGMPDDNLIELLRQQPLIPLSVLFQVDHSSPYYNERSKVSIFYAESWALIHYLMLGNNQAHRAQLSAYLDALGHGATQDQAAEIAFGGLANLQKALQIYVGNLAFFELKTQAPSTISESQVVVRSLSDSEAEAYQGGFLELHGQYQEAAALLREAAQSDPKLALAQQNLAILDDEQGDRADERTALNAAIELDPKNYLTRFLRADLTENMSGLTDNAQQMETDLRASIAANPNFPPAIGLLSSCLAANNRELPEALEFAKKSVSLEPGNTHYQLVLARALAQLRQYDQAEAIANRAWVNSTSPEQKTYAEQMIDYIHGLQLAGSNRDKYTALPAGGGAQPKTATAARNPGGSGPSGNLDGVQKFKIIETQPDDGRKLADGRVVTIQCKVQEMLVTISTENGPVRLHVADYSKVDFISDVPLKSDVYYPCTELKGKSVKATFLPKPSKASLPYEGEIERVEVKD